MKVTIYALHLGFGGVEKYVATLANILSREHDVQIIATYKTTPEPAFFIEKKVAITYVLPHLLPNQQAFKEACRRKNPFAILKEGIFSAYVLHQRKKQNKKMIQKDDSDIILSTRIFHNQLISKYASQRAIKITGEHNHPHGNEKYIEDVVASCANFDYFIPISKALCDLYEERFSSKIKVQYIPFCIEESGVHQHVFPKSHRLINVGRFSPEKGILDLLDVIEYLVHEKQFPVHLDLIGSGEMEQAIREKVQQLQLEKNVILHGFQNKDYIYHQYQSASLYLMCSYTESFGIVLLEAMSCGLPCVAYDSAEGSREIITAGKDGILIPNRNLQAMAKEIISLLEQEETYMQMSEQAFQKAEQYSYRKCEQAWLTFFETLQVQLEKRM